MKPKSSVARSVLATTLSVGECTLKLATGELIRDGDPILLGGRALNLLLVLLEAEGDLVTIEDILKRVWDGVVVEQNTIQAHVSSLRRALRGDRHLLKTYSGRGYRLLASADSEGNKVAFEANAEQGAPIAKGLVAPHALPSASSELIGRERLLTQIQPLLREHRLVTLTGAGGIGKTRLVLEVARTAQQEFAGGIFFFDLAPVRDAQFLSSALITSTGAVPSFHLSLAERARALGPVPVLIVLDNCEHLVVAVAEAVDTILRANPAIRLVATSREPLRAPGEVVFKVPPLDVPARDEVANQLVITRGAVRLFLSRSPDLYAQFMSMPNAAVEVARICRNLDGIPLAIELAAARAVSLGIETVATRLHDSLDLLKGGARTALARHQTLRATLDWSYELLSVPERTVFAGLAVFAGGFTLEAACQILANDSITEAGVLEHVADLVDKSLIAFDPGSVDRRYRFLETTRAFALEKLCGAGEFDRLSRRHAQYRLDALCALGLDRETPSVRSHLASFGTELENVRAALDWAYSDTGDVALGFSLSAYAVPLMLDSFLIEEVLIHAARAIDKTPPELIADKTQDLRIRISMVSFQIYMQGSGERVMREWNEVLERARALRNQAFEIRALWGLWTVSSFAGYPRLALGFADRFASLAREIGNESAVVLGYRIRGVTDHFLGNQHDARRQLEAIISRYVYSVHPTILGGTMDHRTAARATLARVLWFQGFVDRALELMEMAVTEAVVQDHPTTTCFVMIECALPLSLLVADIDAARRYLDMLLAALKLRGFVIFQVVADCYSALLSTPGSDVGRSVNLRSAIDNVRRVHYEIYAIDLQLRVAEALRGMGYVSEALSLIDEGIRKVNETGERLWEPELVRVRAEILMQTGHGVMGEVESGLREALRLANQQGALSMELRVGMTLLRALGRMDRHVEGVTLLDAIYERFTEGHMTVDMEKARCMLQAKQA